MYWNRSLRQEYGWRNKSDRYWVTMGWSAYQGDFTDTNAVLLTQEVLTAVCQHAEADNVTAVVTTVLPGSATGVQEFYVPASAALQPSIMQCQ